MLADAAAGNGANQTVSPQQFWVFVGLGVMGLIYLAVIRPMMRRKADPLERPPAFASLSQQRSTERQMQNLLVELSEMARQISAQLDTRAARLEQLIKDADERIETLKSSNNNGSPPAASVALISPSPSAPIPTSLFPEPPDPRHADIYALADQGRDAYQIASELNRPRGEVELILALRSKR
jgi:hypothetical protein